jgi:LDH2 family malate/lactate/ureidoglycolate dehydrogenase
MPIVNPDLLRQLCLDILAAAGLPQEDASIIGEHLVTSNLKGHDSHGVTRLPWYIEQFGEGYVSWDERDVVRETPVMATIDGRGCNGIIACVRAAEMAVEKARVSTFGAVMLSNVTHVGRLGDYPPRIAEQDMIGMAWTNVGGLFVAPFGSADRRMRPNPIAFAVPRRDGPPLMLDMTLSVTAGGKIEQKVARGEDVPEGWLIDDQGRSVADARRFTDDPDEVAMLPLGGLESGHKGHGLSMMMEMIVGPLSLAGTTKEMQGGNGVMVVAIDIEPFTDVDTYKDEVEGLVEWVNSATPLPGVERLYAPGEIEEEKHRRRLREGIDVPEPTWAAIVEVAEELGISVPI